MHCSTGAVDERCRWAAATSLSRSHSSRCRGRATDMVAFPSVTMLPCDQRREKTHISRHAAGRGLQRPLCQGGSAGQCPADCSNPQ